MNKIAIKRLELTITDYIQQAENLSKDNDIVDSIHLERDDDGNLINIEIEKIKR
jgi:hypothetical protein